MLKRLGLGAVTTRDSQKQGFGYQSKLECKLAAGSQDHTEAKSPELGHNPNELRGRLNVKHCQ